MCGSLTVVLSFEITRLVAADKGSLTSGAITYKENLELGKVGLTGEHGIACA